jgi:adenosylcobinamide-GDP ribazoletransferase
MSWFPVVGAVVGGVVAAAWWGAAQLWTPGVAAAVAVGVDLVLTGLLHLDGVADSADGLLPHLERERRLAVMRQPDVGAFGIGVVVMVLLVRWAVLAGAVTTEAGAPGGTDATFVIEPIVLIAVWAMSRTVVAATPAYVPYARAEGLPTALLAGSSRRHLVWFLPAIGLVALASDRSVAGAITEGIATAAAVVAVAVAIAVLARRRLGGFTGDVLGAVVMLSETAALLALAAAP